MLFTTIFVNVASLPTKNMHRVNKYENEKGFANFTIPKPGHWHNLHSFLPP